MLILAPTSMEIRGLFPELPAVPAGGVVPWLSRTSLGSPALVGRCGFGLAAAGARAAACLALTAGDCVLAGIAGALDADRVPLGSVVVATDVFVEGIGFGSPRGVLHPGGCGGALQQEWEAQAPEPPWVPPISGARGGVLSVAASAGSPQEAHRRRLAHPGCLVEEMEGEAVLHAATALGRRVAVVRGVSNVAGDRDASRWQVASALAAVRLALDEWLRP